MGNRLATVARLSRNWLKLAVRSLRPRASRRHPRVEDGSACCCLNLAVLGRNPAAASSKMAWHSYGSLRHSWRGGAPPVPGIGVQSHQDPKRRCIRRIGGIGGDEAGMVMVGCGMRSRSSRCSRITRWASSHRDFSSGAENWRASGDLRWWATPKMPPRPNSACRFQAANTVSLIGGSGTVSCVRLVATVHQPWRRAICPG